MISRDFSVGELRGWYGVLLGLLTSVVLLVAGRQDLGPGLGITIPKQKNERWPSSQQVVGPGLGVASSAFWFLPALILSGGVIWLGIGARIWGGAVLGATFFCLEVWLITCWWRQSRTH